MSKKPKMPPVPDDPLLGCLRGLNASGPMGFEGLVRELMQRWTGRPFRLAQSGSQRGHDIRSDDDEAPVILVEAKRFQQDTGLGARDLGGEIAEAVKEHPDLDLWVLAASKEVGSNEVNLARHAAEAHGLEIFALDARAQGIGPLQAFFARFPETITPFVEQHSQAPAKVKALLPTRLAEIAADAGYDIHVSRLNRILTRQQHGFTGLAAIMARGITDGVTTPDRARALFGQDAALKQAGRKVLPRRRFSADLQNWWTGAGERHCVVLGEEGTGKTWAVVGWLLDLLAQPDPPLVIPITSRSQVSGDLVETLVAAVERLTRPPYVQERSWRSLDGWKRKFSLWLQPDRLKEDRILLLIDGLNETPTADWRGLLTAINALDGRVRVVMTCRPPYWSQRLHTIALVRQMPTDGYDLDELADVLAGTGIDLNDIRDDDLRLLIRRPRYCDLVVTHFAEIVASGDFTIERLLYIDYRDRVERKDGQPIDDARFRQILVELAEKYSHASFNEVALRACVPTPENAEAVIQDIIDGGLLVATGSHSRPYRVEPTRLAYGIGMLLADRLRDHPEDDVEAHAATIQAWFKPQPDMDQKVRALGAAVLLSLPETNPSGYPAAARQALLREWIGARNSDGSKAESITAYLRDCPGDVLAVADYFWRAAEDKSSVQQAYAAALLKRRTDPALLPHLVTAAERWMSYVHVQGDPDWREMEPDKARQFLPLLGDPLIPGTAVDFLGCRLHLTDDDGHLILAQRALFIISAGSVAPFEQAFLHLALSRGVMAHFPECREADWVLRRTDEDLWSRFASRVTVLAESPAEPARSAANSLLLALGARAADDVWKHRLPERWAEYLERCAQRGDPESSWFTLGRDGCESYLRRDLPVEQLAEKARRYFADPSLTPPAAFVDRLLEAAEGLPADRYHGGSMSTIEDQRAEGLFPALARCAPTALGDFFRRAVANIPARKLEDVPWLAHGLPNYSLVLLPDSLKAVQDYATAVAARHEDWTGHDRSGEAFAILALAMGLPADELVDRLIDRPARAYDLFILDPWRDGLSVAAGERLLERLLTETDPVRLRRILYALVNADLAQAPQDNRPSLTDAHRNVIAAALASEHDHLRGAALRFITHHGDPTLVMRAVTTPLASPPNSTTPHWFSAVIARHATEQPLAYLATCMPLGGLGRVVTKRGAAADDVRFYTTCLDKTLERITAAVTGKAAELPPVLIDLSGEVPMTSQPRQDTGGLRLEIRRTTWGRGNSASAEQIQEAFAPDETRRQQDWEDYWRKLGEVLSLPEADWFGEWFDRDALRAVTRLHPGKVKRWVDQATANESLLDHAESFWQFLCVALAHEDPPEGFRLWRALRNRNDKVTWTVHHSRIDMMTALPFSAPDSAEARAARAEMVDHAWNDAMLFDIAAAASAHGRGDWLYAEAARHVTMDPLWRRAKGLTLAAFSNLDSAAFNALVSQSDISDTWVEEILPALRRRHDKNQWARHWYKEFLVTPDNEVAYARFVLFLDCADRRCRAWIPDLEEASRQAGGLDEQRVKYRRTVEQTIRNAIKTQEKELDERFLTKEFRRGELAFFEDPTRGGP